MITVKQAASFAKLKDALRTCYDSVFLSLAVLRHFKSPEGTPELGKGYAVFRVQMLRASLYVCMYNLKALFWLFGMQDEL